MTCTGAAADSNVSDDGSLESFSTGASGGEGKTTLTLRRDDANHEVRVRQGLFRNDLVQLGFGKKGGEGIAWSYRGGK